jgi:hypothetical protein
LVSQLREDLLLCSSYLPLGVPNGLYLHAIKQLSGTVAGEKEDFCKGSLSLTIFYFVFVLLYFIFCFFACIFLSKIQKNSFYFKLLFMSSLVVATMSSEEMIFTFKQKSEESFKEAWSRIYDWHEKTKLKMTLSLLLSSFNFGLALRYRYALDTTVEGDFLHCDGDQAFNIIKKLITIYNMPTDFDSSLVSIFTRLNTFETHTACLGNRYSTLREHFDYVPINSEPSSWFPTVKITINGETYHARCDILSYAKGCL